MYFRPLVSQAARRGGAAARPLRDGKLGTDAFHHDPAALFGLGGNAMRPKAPPSPFSSKAATEKQNPFGAFAQPFQPKSHQPKSLADMMEKVQPMAASMFEDFASLLGGQHGVAFTESEAASTLRMYVGGDVTAKDVSVQMANNELAIRVGANEAETFLLPSSDYDSNGVTFSVADGILKVTLPRASQSAGAAAAPETRSHAFQQPQTTAHAEQPQRAPHNTFAQPRQNFASQDNQAPRGTTTQPPTPKTESAPAPSETTTTTTSTAPAAQGTNTPTVTVRTMDDSILCECVLPQGVTADGISLDLHPNGTLELKIARATTHTASDASGVQTTTEVTTTTRTTVPVPATTTPKDIRTKRVGQELYVYIATRPAATISSPQRIAID